MELAPKKRSNGRRKIPIEKIADKTRKQVTFSKRRSGLFKKASELCALCGVEMAILTFSERGKLFCFSHPNPDDIVRRYVSSECGVASPCDAEDDVMMRCNERALMVEDHKGIKRKIDEEKKFADYQVITNKEGKKSRFWWDEAPIHEMGLDELEQFMACLLELRNNVAKQVDQFTGANLSFPYNHMMCEISVNTPPPPMGILGNNSIPMMARNNVTKQVDQFTGGNLSFPYNHMMGDISVNRPLPPRGILGNNNIPMTAAGKEDTMIDIVTRQSFSFSFMDMGMEDYSGNKELCQYSNASQGMDSLDLNDINHHHHQLAMMEDHNKTSLINLDFTPQQQAFQYGTLYF